ncbi:dihydroxy-acid dehydratase [Romboutsia sp. CE17]|uniref:dihydroxy-acid dehydratase n=1 Tax=Romboutsia sp. CE17 TaxID=2724150 RepID=UPI001442B014|nr:dihydroxy-acid dehydratase [Romboutsia sp. CE17]QJA08350.1 dihydroxy-acid dehydratase [Romboutsia sp. CE17]
MKSDNIKRGLTKAPHRSLLKASGYTDEEINKPFVGIVNSFNEIVPGHIHLRELSEAVKRGILLKGGTPLEFPSIAVCDGIAMNHEGMKYSLVSREIIADSIEIMAKAHSLDGLVLIPSCDKVVPGMLMAAARINIPCIVVSGGPMLAGKYKGNRVDLITTFEGVGKVANNDMSEEELLELEEVSCPTCGSCAGMFTANSMNCMTEGLGMALKGNGTIPAVYSERKRLAKKTGMKIMELIERDIKARDIMTKEAFENALALDMSLGCSTNTVLHLSAIAHEAKVDMNLDIINEVSSRVPNLCKLSPAGNNYIEDLYESGGVYAVMNELNKINLINADLITCEGDLIKNLLVEKKNNYVIRDIDNPYSKEGGIKVLRGNLALDGAVIKKSAVDSNVAEFVGKAKVYESEEECVDAILSGQIKKGDVVIIRYEGPKGGPGMREMLTPTSTLCGMGLDADVCLITDGRFSGGSRGFAIGHVSPEAAEGGLIAYVCDNDLIKVNLEKGTIDLLVDENTISERKLKIEIKQKNLNGYLKKYSALVSSAGKGAICD